MKTYIVDVRLMLKYPDLFGIDNVEEWRGNPQDEKWVDFREESLPPEVAEQAQEVDSYVVDEETGLKYTADFLLDSYGRYNG
ncbi:hypothetical protein ACFLU4_02105 [Chloroflexota bacterium]